MIKVSGLKEVQAALYSYSRQLGDKVVLAALKQGANLVKRAVVQTAPVKSGRLKRGFRVANSRIHRGRGTGRLGVYLALRTKKKGDPFYGRFQEDGWNVKGPARGKGRSARVPGSRSGRKTAPGKRDVPGKFFIQKAYLANREAAAQLIIKAAEVGAEIVKRKVGLR